MNKKTQRKSTIEGGKNEISSNPPQWLEVEEDNGKRREKDFLATNDKLSYYCIGCLNAAFFFYKISIYDLPY